MKKIIILLGLLWGVMGFFSKADAISMKEGDWSITMVTKADGSFGNEMSDFQKKMEKMSAQEKSIMEQTMKNMGVQMGANGGGMTIKVKQCITSDNPVPEQKNQGSCKQTHTIKGNTVNFEVTCPERHSTGEVTYNNDSMQGIVKSTEIKNGKAENVSINLSGQYVGPCLGD